MFTLEEKTREWERRHPQYARRATPENETRYAEMCEQVTELAEMAEESAMAELEAFGCIEFEDEEPMPMGTPEEAHAFLTARVDVLDEECEESGVEDALDWERWDEYENALYCLAEFELF